MKKPLIGLLCVLASVVVSLKSEAATPPTVKEWTVLVFLNGHNNLDQFGTLNMNQMKEVGSSDQVNIVVQWASLKNKQTRRVFVEKGNWKVVETMSPVDMGDYRQLVNFVEWAQKNYPAKKYMIDIWNHGNGWHRLTKSGEIKPQDISYDDLSGNKITTEQLGDAMAEIAKITGNKVELYASDACLMSMAEVAAEMKDSVKFFAGSQEVEPGEGWPYNKFLAPLVKTPTMDGGELAKTLSKEYLAAYNGGIYGRKSVTFSAMDLSKMDSYMRAMKTLATELKNLNSAGLQAARAAIQNTQAFSSNDYKDVMDYMLLIGKANLVSVDELNRAKDDLVISNDVSAAFSHAHGVSVWLPESKYEWTAYGARYLGLEFNKATGWGDTLQLLVQ